MNYGAIIVMPYYEVSKLLSNGEAYNYVSDLIPFAEETDEGRLSPADFTTSPMPPKRINLRKKGSSCGASYAKMAFKAWSGHQLLSASKVCWTNQVMSC
jgi:hypothetical protein